MIHSLSQAISAYRTIAQSDGKSPRTIEWVESSACYLQKFLGDDVSLEAITPHEVKRWVLGLRQRKRWPGRPEMKDERPLSATSINNYVRGVKLLLSTLAREGLIAENPVQGYRAPRVPETIPPSLTEQQVSQLLEAPDLARPLQLRDWAMMATLYDSKCRVSELCHLAMPNLSLEYRRFVVVGKGGRRLIYYFNDEASRAIQRWLAVRPDPAPGVDNVFVSWDGHPLTRHRVYRIIKAYGVKAWVTGVRVSPHTFQHTGARAHLRLGGGIKQLQLLLNHRDISSTMVYAQLEGIDARRAADQFSPLDALAGRRMKRRDPLEDPNVRRLMGIVERAARSGA